MARFQILLHRWGPRTWTVWRFLSGGLNHSLVSSMGQAKRRKSITFDSTLKTGFCSVQLRSGFP